MLVNSELGILNSIHTESNGWYLLVNKQNARVKPKEGGRGYIALVLRSSKLTQSKLYFVVLTLKSFKEGVI